MCQWRDECPHHPKREAPHTGHEMMTERQKEQVNRSYPKSPRKAVTFTFKHKFTEQYPCIAHAYEYRASVFGQWFRRPGGY